ncbi:MAG: ComEC/Rec2 family competence protein [Prevotella sp.]|nr:ComEC/Rec2 family competence protein [Prevotella sp.]
MRPSSDIHLCPMAFVAVAVALGIWAADAFRLRLPLLAVVAIALGLFAVGAMTSRKSLISDAAVLFGAFFFGVAVCLSCLERIPSVVLGEEEEWEGVVMSRPQQHGRVFMADVMVARGRLAGHSLRVSIYADDRSRRLDEGFGIRCRSAVEPIEDFGPERNFSFRRWAMSHDIVGRTFLYSTAWTTANVRLTDLSRAERIVVKSRLLRRKIGEKLHAQFSDADAEGIVSAMVVGDKSGLTKELRDMYSVVGASHVLALSGMHLGIIFCVLSYVFFRRRFRFFGLLAVLCVIWGYALLTGLSPSILRAAIMLTVYSFADILVRRHNALNTLGIAALAILTVSPLSLWDVGFQMSFMSMLGIVVLYSPLYTLIPLKIVRRYWLVDMLWQICCISLSAQVGVAPLVAFYFCRFSCYFLLSSIVVSVMAFLILSCSVVALPMILLGVFPGVAGSALALLAKVQNSLLGGISSLPHASIENIRINHVQLILMYVVIAALFALAGRVLLIVKRSRVWQSISHAADDVTS